MESILVVLVIGIIAWFYDKNQKKKLAWIKLVVIKEQKEKGVCWCNPNARFISDWEREAVKLGIYPSDSYATLSRLGWNLNQVQEKLYTLESCYSANLPRWCYTRDTP